MACDTMEGGWSSVSEGYVISDMMACNELHTVVILPVRASNEHGQAHWFQAHQTQHWNSCEEEKRLSDAL